MPSMIPCVDLAELVMLQGKHQAQGLQRLFSSEAASRLVSVLATPNAPDSSDFVLALADALTRFDERVCLVDTRSGHLSTRLGCRPLLPWQSSRAIESQIVAAGGHGLLFAPGCMAGEASIAAVAKTCGNFDIFLFDGGCFTLNEVPLEPATTQFLIVLLGKGDAEMAYALLKALKVLRSPVQVLLLGEQAEHLAQMAKNFLNETVASLNTGDDLCHIRNKIQETSSNTLTIVPNLSWVVSRIMENDNPKVAHGGIGKSAKEVQQ